MTSISLDISAKIEKHIVDVCSVVAECASTLGIPYIIVGASARDMVMRHGYGLVTTRATADIDYAVQVMDWKEFSTLKTSLINNSFKPSRVEHRLLSLSEIPIDIVPFGGIADIDKTIRWPPDGETVMNVWGFTEALEHAYRVRLRNMPELVVPVASPEGMMLLKLIAWSDRAANQRSKDASDIAYLLHGFEEIKSISETLYDEAKLMSLYDYDLKLACAHKLGERVRAITSKQSALVITNTFESANPKLTFQMLIDDMVLHSPIRNAEELIRAFAAGFR